MPTYEYHCPACKKSYELRQGFDAETTHVCEQCGKGTAKRVLHAPKVVFKGSGWYVTDSRNKTTAVTNPDSASDASAETSADSAPAETAPAKEKSKKSDSAPKGESTSEPAAAG